MRLDHPYTKNEKEHQKQTIYTEKKKKTVKITHSKTFISKVTN